MRSRSWWMPEVRGAALLLIALGAAFAVVPGPLAAQVPSDEKRIVAGAGADLVAGRCGVCHDLSHITRSRLARGEWEDNLAMMVKRGMPPLPPAESEAVLAYLSRHYGPKGPAPGLPFFGAAVDGAPVDVARLVAANGCEGCHAVDRRVVGPSFREVAARHAASGDVAALARKLREGGVGAWGQVPMPAMPQLTQVEAEALVRHVLATDRR